MLASKCCIALNRMSRFLHIGSMQLRGEVIKYLSTSRLNNIEVEEEEVNVSDSPNTGQQSNISVDKKRC